MQEVWKDVVGFESYFKVSSSGQVFSKRSGRILKQHINKDGYRTLATKIGGRTGTNYCFKVHRLVAEAFLPPPDDILKLICSTQAYGLVIVRHKDNDPANCNYTNLIWGSYQDNSDDMVAAGRNIEHIQRTSGEKNYNSRLSFQQVEDIRKRYRPRCKTNGARALAKIYGVCHSQISRYVSREKYSR